MTPACHRAIARIAWAPPMKTILASALVACALLSACTAEDALPETGPTVTVKSNTFEPSTITIKVGQTVTWEWESGVHNVVSGTSCTPDGKFTSGSPVSGATYDHRFDEAGTFDYFCEPHCSQGMVGKVIVQ